MTAAGIGPREEDVDDSPWLDHRDQATAAAARAASRAASAASAAAVD